MTDDKVDIVKEAKKGLDDYYAWDEGEWEYVIGRLIAEVERLRSNEQYAANFDLHAEIDINNEQIDSLTKELEVAGLQRREDYSHIKKLEAENAELRSNAKYIADNVYMKEIKALTAKLASFKKYVEELKQQMSCEHDPVFHEMGYPGYNDACWVCDKCNKYMGNDYEGGPTK